MAGRPKKEETVDVAVENTSGNEEMLDSMKQMKLEMEELRKENETLKKTETTTIAEEISLDTEIEVMSLYAGTLNLFTEGFGNGTVYKFEDGYGSVIDIPFIDLKLIVKNNYKIAKDGYFYILNENAVNLLRLKKTYDSLLSAEQMESLSKSTVEQVATLYNSAPESQKKLIINYFATKKADKENVDMSILYKLQEISGKKLLD